MTDQGSQFRKTFVDIVAISDVEIQRTGIESRHNLNIGERYHSSLRNTYIKLKSD